MDLVDLIERQQSFSTRTFGPGYRTGRVASHLLKELRETADTPDDVEEWADVVLLALDGAWRSGYSPREIAETVCVRFAEVDSDAVYWGSSDMSLEKHVCRQAHHVLHQPRVDDDVKGLLLSLRSEVFVLGLGSGSLQTWVNIVLLGLSGACMTGEQPSAIAAAITGKLAKNEQRDWPDWRSARPDRPIEHIRG